VQGDYDDADNAVRDWLAVQLHLLQPPPRFHIDRHPPVAVWQAPPGVFEGEFDCN